MNLTSIFNPVRRYYCKKEIEKIVNDKFDVIEFYDFGVDHASTELLNIKTKKLPYSFDFFVSEMEKPVIEKGDPAYTTNIYDFTFLYRCSTQPEGFYELPLAKIKSQTYLSRFTEFQEKIKLIDEEVRNNPKNNPFYSSIAKEEFDSLLEHYNSLDIKKLKLEEPISCPACGGLGIYSIDWKCLLCQGHGNLSAEVYKEYHNPTHFDSTEIHEFIPHEIAVRLVANERGLYAPVEISSLHMKIVAL